MARFTHPALGDGSGIGILYPFHGSFYSMQEQSLATTSEIKAIRYEITDLSQGITIENNLLGQPTQITMENPAIYNIQFSAQLYNLGGGGSSSAVDIWLSKNGNNVDNSNTRVAVNANSPYIVASWNFFVDANEEDYFELLWKTNHTNNHIHTSAAYDSVPAIPSVILTVNQIG